MKHARYDYNRFQDPALEDPSLLGEGSTPIAEDEPVFLLRAQDKHAAKVVAYYAGLLAMDLNVDPEMAALCTRWAAEMDRWRPPGDFKKSPDMPGI